MTYTKKQIETIKGINPFASKNVHGNTKRVNGVPVADYLAILSKKYNRKVGNFVSKSGKVVKSNSLLFPKETNVQKVRRLIKWSKECKGTNYFKTLIEGNTGIYYAHPDYGHSDYNKTRVFDKTPETLRLMEIFNKIVNK